MMFIINISLCLFYLIVPIRAVEQLDHEKSIGTVSASRFLDVESLLKKCAKRLGVYDSAYQDPLWCPPLGCDRSSFVTVSLRGEDGNIERYEVYDPRHELMNGHEFTPADRASGGTRVVGFYSIEGQKRLCFKQWPEAPGHEIAAYSLYSILFPEDHQNMPIPSSEVILMNKQVFLISQLMEGESLEEIFRKVDQDPEYGRNWVFNTKRFQKLVFFSLLANPEDCRPQNCLVRKMRGRDEFEIVLIDNERTFGEESTEYTHAQKGRIKTRVHCVLFCFEELFKKKVSKKFLARQHLDDKDVIYTWIEKCSHETPYEERLRQELTEEDKGKTQLGTFHGETFISNILKKLHIIKNMGDKSLAEIFRMTNDFWLAETYKIIGYGNVENRFKAIDLNFVRQRIFLIDGGRAGSVAPPSSYVPIGNYFGSIDAPNTNSVISLLQKNQEEHSMKKTFDELFGIESDEYQRLGKDNEIVSKKGFRAKINFRACLLKKLLSKDEEEKEKISTLEKIMKETIG